MGCGPQETFRSCADIEIVFHPLLMSAAIKNQKDASLLQQEENNFYDISLHENELGPASPAEDTDFTVGKNHITHTV